ncbi:dipeptidase 1-like isoform X2 [Portunus trituberculatus]|uniref:dipeptidase 1-like isoform X2 n=1 Tax=Portunus trituberculatus TaxID=210409 RepID=UPI001E1CF2F9|nr:dipeptidase 1-like isoform X2 [Portunus trituberculatus]
MGRVVVVVVVAAATAAAGCRASPLPVRVSPDAPPQERLQAAHTLLATSPLIDGHNDLAWNVRKFLHNKLHSFNLSSDLTKEKPWRNSRFSHTDLPRLRKGQVAAQFWSVYVPCGAQYLNTVQLLLEQVDTVRRMVAASPHDTVLVRSSSEILEEFRRGRVASLMGVEGGHGLASSMGVVRALYDLGVRYVTLTHKCHTPWAECSEPDPHLPNTRGLTPYGKELVREMNRLGLMVDLSHASARTARDVLNTTRAPVIFSHSAARALCRIERNVPDDVLSSLAENGGIVMISFYNDFLTCSEKASVQDVVAHINHVRSMAGVDHVGLGAGYDGINRTPSGLEDASRYPKLFAELLKDTTWSVQDLKKLAGLNFLRVFARVEQVREELSSERPSEEIIPIHDIDSRWPCRYKFARLDDART